MLISRPHTTTGGGPHPPVILDRSRGTCHPGVGLSDALCPRSTAPRHHATQQRPVQLSGVAHQLAQCELSVEPSSHAPKEPRSPFLQHLQVVLSQGFSKQVLYIPLG